MKTFVYKHTYFCRKSLIYPELFKYLLLGINIFQIQKSEIILYCLINKNNKNNFMEWTKVIQQGTKQPRLMDYFKQILSQLHVLDSTIRVEVIRVFNVSKSCFLLQSNFVIFYENFEMIGFFSVKSYITLDQGCLTVLSLIPLNFYSNHC